jgi:hypothetical protein
MAAAKNLYLRFDLVVGMMMINNEIQGLIKRSVV